MINKVQHAPIEAVTPIRSEARIFSLLSYTMMMWATLIVIQAFVLGQTLLPPHGELNLLQAILVIIVSCTLIAIFMSLNGQPGLKHGIPYSIQLRTTFGVRGSRVPQALRLIPALIWYGIGTWIAALSMDGIVYTLTGYSPPEMKYIYFLALQTIQTWLAYEGVRVMKWFNVYASVALVLLMGNMMINVLHTHSLELSQTWYTEGTWGLPFWVGINTVIGGLAAVIANSSDLSRYLEPKQISLWLGNFLGILLPLGFMITLGLMASVATNEWDPVEALMELSPSVELMLLLLVFILIAQFSTSLTLNILPTALIFEEAFGVSWQRGVILSGILGALTFPWFILQSGENLILFISYYTCFFGPIVGCMIADYNLRGHKMDLDQIYLNDATSPYWFRHGINWAGILAILLPAVVTMIWSLKVSWLIGLPLGYIIYRILYPWFTRPERESGVPDLSG